MYYLGSFINWVFSLVLARVVLTFRIIFIYDCFQSGFGKLGIWSLECNKDLVCVTGNWSLPLSSTQSAVLDI